MSTDPRGAFRRVVTMVVATALILAVGLPPVGTNTAGAQEKPKPEPERKPKSITVQVYVIMASKAAKPHADASLKELAGLLKGRFNHFTLHRSAKESIKLGKQKRFSLAADYYLKAEYRDAKSSKIVLKWHLVRLVTSGGKTREVGVTGPHGVTVTRGKFFLIGGPPVGDKTMLLAVRVMK